jgi:hypothetical protein
MSTDPIPAEDRAAAAYKPEPRYIDSQQADQSQTPNVGEEPYAHLGTPNQTEADVSRAGSAADITHRFAYHPPKDPKTVHEHETVRALVGGLASDLDQFLPYGREKSLAITKLEEAMFWANAAIARNP